MIKNEKYSHKDFTGKSFKHLPASEFNNMVIVGSCFAQEVCTDKITQIDIFHDDVVNMNFERSNLINVYLPPTCLTDSDCSKHKELSVDTETIINVDKDEVLSKRSVTLLTKSEYLLSFEIYKADKLALEEELI